MNGFPFPHIDPVLVSLGPFQIRWYALAYLAGFVLGLMYIFALIEKNSSVRPSRKDVDSFLLWAVVGVIVGGRLFYVLFYNLPYYVDHWWEIPLVNKGGMSFHGGLTGITLALWFYAKHQGFSPFRLGDLVAAAGPIGLFFGRLANFVNGELYGRPTDVSWAVVFPSGGPEPRHPSQLYEAALEGLLLFAVLAVLIRISWIRQRPGFVGGVFFLGYAICRFSIEFFREPDTQIGYLWAGATMGQLLCLPMAVFGIFLMCRALLRPREGS